MALPATLNPSRPLGNDATNDPASSIDNQIRDLKQLIADLFGIPVDPTSLTAPIMSITAAGVVSDLDIGTAAPATPVANRLYTDSIVKGWVETSGAGSWTIDDDLNVSSITDNGVGDFTINWATAFANANYAVIGTVIDNATGASNNALTVKERTATAKAVGSVRLAVQGLDGAGVQALVDPGQGISVIAIGDQ